MSVRAYQIVCGIFLLAALLFIVTGNFTMMTAVVFGFIAFGLTFMGMMNVLPLHVSHPPAPKPVATESTAVQKMSETPAKTFGVLKSA